MSYVYRYVPGSGRARYEVGYYLPARGWHTESEHKNGDTAADRVHWLNGGEDRGMQTALMELLQTASRVEGKAR